MLQGRDLDPEEVLPLLRERSASLTAQYLEHLITHRGSQDAQHHTELALTLSRSILARMPPFDKRCACLVWLFPSLHTAILILCGLAVTACFFSFWAFTWHFVCGEHMGSMDAAALGRQVVPSADSQQSPANVLIPLYPCMQLLVAEAHVTQ